MRSVGEGAFSQILVCDDTYAVDAENQAREGCPPMVAIKVMNLKYTDIGAQELVMLRFLNQMGKREAGIPVPLVMPVSTCCAETR